MSRVVTLELSDELIERAERLAALTRRGVAQVLADAVAVALPPINLPPATGTVHDLSDGQVLELARLELPADTDARLSRLLSEQQAGVLSIEERAELLQLMQRYELGLLRKSEALAEAARRGLPVV